MTSAEILASVRLTNHGATQITCTPRTAAQKLALACTWETSADEIAATLAAVIRRCPSLIAWPIDPGTGEIRTVHLLSSINGFAKDDVATIQIPAHHVERQTSARTLALTIAGLLA